MTSATRTGHPTYEQRPLSFGLWHVRYLWSNLIPLRRRRGSFTVQLEPVKGTFPPGREGTGTLSSWWVAEQDYSALERKLERLERIERTALALLDSPEEVVRMQEPRVKEFVQAVRG